ncbi:MAG TPA: MFS transporter [Aurantimonas coralicida]|uniref:MFS transporter n=1 Tax=Aurantimonas coralicida TaxID=182270 RepID=A0A9C9TG78_9HYPH|nr:MFS transporter [Aurantimonas coralicida]HET99432.1 MFS transporter [Aurantimonas coralicida]
MLSVLRHRTYRHLFTAQVLSLIGTGLTTVALGLLAYDLAGADAGAVLGTALAIKMVAYVGVSPFAGVLTSYLPRRALLVILDLCRAGLVFLLPFVTEIWQVYALVFAFQSFSAAFTPTFQATIPDILADEKDYTNALSLSRLAYDLESLLSPLLAGVLLTVISFHWLFVGTTLGFLSSAVLVVSVALPVVAKASTGSSFLDRLTLGSRIYLATPRLRGLLALAFAAASGGAMVIVNTVVHVRESLGGTNEDVAYLFAAYGLGSMTVAIILSRLLDRLPVRAVMVSGAGSMAVLLSFGSLGAGWEASVVLWALLGAASSLIGTPAGLLLRRSSDPGSRPAVFAAQFALSHACWLVTYPLAGWLGARLGLDATFMVMAVGAGLGTTAALLLWPANDPVEVEHEHAGSVHDALHVHDDLHHQHDHEGWEGPEPHRHPHRHGPTRHVHPFVIDDHHPVWPSR